MFFYKAKRSNFEIVVIYENVKNFTFSKILYDKILSAAILNTIV